MKILDLLDRADTFRFAPPPTFSHGFRATLDEIDQLWVTGDLNDDESELLSYVSYHLRHFPNYRISDSIVRAIELIRAKVQSAT